MAVHHVLSRPLQSRLLSSAPLKTLRWPTKVENVWTTSCQYWFQAMYLKQWECSATTIIMAVRRCPPRKQLHVSFNSVCDHACKQMACRKRLAYRLIWQWCWARRRWSSSSSSSSWEQLAMAPLNRCSAAPYKQYSTYNVVVTTLVCEWCEWRQTLMKTTTSTTVRIQLPVALITLELRLSNNATSRWTLGCWLILLIIPNVAASVSCILAKL